MNNESQPSPALLKARELELERQNLLVKNDMEATGSWMQRVERAFPSILSELEKVTKERDEAARMLWELEESLKYDNPNNRYILNAVRKISKALTPYLS